MKPTEGVVRKGRQQEKKGNDVLSFPLQLDPVQG